MAVESGNILYSALTQETSSWKPWCAAIHPQVVVTVQYIMQLYMSRNLWDVSSMYLGQKAPTINYFCIRNALPNQPWLGDRFLNHVQLWPAMSPLLRKRHGFWFDAVPLGCLGKCQWLMMESLSGTDDGWQCQCFIKGQMTCCRGRQWHCLVPEAFRCSFTMFLLKIWVSRSFPYYSLSLLQKHLFDCPPNS